MNFKEKNIMAYSINGIVSSQEEISELFNPSPEDSENKKDKTAGDEGGDTIPQNDNNDDNNDDVTEIADPLDLFKDTQSERVGTEDDDDDNPEEQERDLEKQKSEGSSPKLYSSVAHSLADEGALSYLTDEEIDAITDVQSFVDAVRKNNEAQLDEMQKRVNDALNAGVQPNAVKWYEDVIAGLNNLTEDQLSAEGDKGEELRKSIIYQYYMVTTGGSKERAEKMVTRAFESGTDIADAKEFLEDLKNHYTTEYNNLIEEGKAQVAEAKKKQEEDVKKLKKTILEDKKVLGDIEIDAKTRQLAFDNLMKPTHRTENGIYQTEIQKYMAEHPTEFQMKVALLFTMTDGFSKMGNVLQGNVKKAKKQALKDLEDVISGSKRTPNGGINFNAKDEDSTFNIHFAPPELWKK